MKTDEPRTVLVVDDERHIRENLVDALEDFGFKALGAGSGEEGLEILDRARVHACTVDMRLPGMNGNAFILAAHARHPALRFVVYTGTPKYDIPAEVAALGVTLDHVVKKPAPDVGVLINALNDLMNRAPAAMGDGGLKA